ncbi:unnamed protein product [Larinioides sclopetarius]|uniref:THAP-type domain-containing protein n=1 Tax=Larinioides sclopetarius TaxID=280406 RepID=A0AAV2AKI3_9ARAC
MMKDGRPGKCNFVERISKPKICSMHFAEECFDKNNLFGTWLKPNAFCQPFSIFQTIYRRKKGNINKKNPESCKKAFSSK